MSIKRIYNLVFIVGMIIWFFETAYFGWNDTAQSGAERVMDIIVLVMMFVGSIGSVAITATEEYLKSITKHE